MLESWKLFRRATGTELMRKCSGWVIRDQRRCCWADIMVVRTHASANQRPEWGHKWPIRGQDSGGGCSHRMRVTGTLIEIKNQQRMQSSYVEGETLYSRELGSQARRHGSRWNNCHLEPESNHFIRLSSPSLSLAGLMARLILSVVMTLFVMTFVPGIVTLWHSLMMGPSALVLVTRYGQLSPRHNAATGPSSLLSALCSRPLISPSRVTHLWRKSGHSTFNLYASFSVSRILQSLGSLSGTKGLGLFSCESSSSISYNLALFVCVFVCNGHLWNFNSCVL